MDRTGIGLVCLSLCALIYLVRGQANVVNVALGKTYNQSSKFNENDSPTMAANGDTSRFYSDNCIHTDDNNDLYPWWQVDLGTTYPVYDITVWARNNHQHRLYPSTITVDGQTCTSITPFPADSREQTVTCSSVMNGQRVRITRQGTSQDSTANRTLILCEMQIWVCQDGYHRTNPATCVRCSANCLNQSCDKVTGKCNGCVDGRYADQCDKFCQAANCERCDQNTGTVCSQCTQDSNLQVPDCTECRDAYYKTSPTTCVRCSINCQSQSCAKQTGKCHGCIEGRYRDMCTDNCPASNCRRCDQDSGVCSQCTLDSFLQLPLCTECQDGYYKTSPTTCVLCSFYCQSQNCSKETGKCHGCFEGRYKAMCTDNCPTVDCRRCDQDSGKCEECAPNSFLQPPDCTECQDGYYRTSSGSCVRCNNNCLSQSCDKQTGKCNGCIDGRYQDMCTVGCPTSSCRRCDQDSGECVECALNSFLQPPDCIDCQDGYYKPSPSDNRCERCTWTCQSGTVCDKTTGHCPLCPPGRQGDRCDQDCDAGRYGENCTGRCAQCLNQQRPGYCDSETGHCVDGCLDGWQPPLCNQGASPSTTDV